jgi:hypothetical protein
MYGDFCSFNRTCFRWAKIRLILEMSCVQVYLREPRTMTSPRAEWVILADDMSRLDVPTKKILEKESELRVSCCAENETKTPFDPRLSNVNGQLRC